MITNVWLSPNRLEIAFAEDDGMITVYDTETGRENLVVGIPREWAELEIPDDRQ
jgi:hypothetical protein